MPYTIRVCSGFACTQNLSEDIMKEIKKLVRDNDDIEVEKRGCFTQCDKGPNLEVVNEETGKSKIYNQVGFGDIGKIVDEIN